MKTLLTLLLSIFLVAPVSAAERKTGGSYGVQVAYVIDGDTFKSSDGETIRLWGINAPERKQPGYWKAGLVLDTMISGKLLDCEFKELDKYKRSVMQCFLDGKDVAAVMVITGTVRDYPKYSGGRYSGKSE